MLYIIIVACKRSSDYDAQISYMADITTIKWPTDVMLPGNAQKVPDDLRRLIDPRLRNAFALNLVLYSMTPA